MICPNCHSDNSEENLFCNKCGTKLTEIPSEQDEKLNSNVEPEQNNKHSASIYKKKIVISIATIIIVLVAGILGYSSYTKNKKDQEAKAYHDKYELNFATTTLDILTENLASQLMCSQVSNTWRDAINSSYKDFNTEISKLENQWKDSGLLKEREDAKNKIENNMKQLKNPPKDYEESYKLFIELYSIYGQIYSQAISPQGSLLTYNQDVNQKSSQFDAIYDKIKVIKPDIEAKGKKK